MQKKNKLKNIIKQKKGKGKGKGKAKAFDNYN